MRRAALLSEAARVARALKVLLDRATFSSEQVEQLIEQLSEQEQVELQRAYGRIEPRRRFKGMASHPMLDGRIISLLFVDESGKSHPEPKLPGPQFFTLGAVALSQEAAEAYCLAADQIKQEFFGKTDFSFHEPFMRERYQERKTGIDYSFSRDEGKREAFDAAIARLIENTEFLSFGVGVRKLEFQGEFIETGIDPYLPTDVYGLAITLLLERYIDALAHASIKQMGRVTFESQGAVEDAYHQMEYARTILDGTQWVPDSAFQNWLQPGLSFQPKGQSSPLELADFFSRDLFEWVRSDCTAVPKWWRLYCAKVYVRGDGAMGKFGIKIFPDSSIRDRVLDHRTIWGALGLEEN